MISLNFYFKALFFQINLCKQGFGNLNKHWAASTHHCFLGWSHSRSSLGWSFGWWRLGVIIFFLKKNKIFPHMESLSQPSTGRKGCESQVWGFHIFFPFWMCRGDYMYMDCWMLEWQRGFWKSDTAWPQSCQWDSLFHTAFIKQENVIIHIVLPVLSLLHTSLLKAILETQFGEIILALF